MLDKREFVVYTVITVKIYLTRHSTGNNVMLEFNFLRITTSSGLKI